MREKYLFKNLGVKRGGRTFAQREQTFSNINLNTTTMLSVAKQPNLWFW